MTNPTEPRSEFIPPDDGTMRTRDGKFISMVRYWNGREWQSLTSANGRMPRFTSIGDVIKAVKKARGLG